MALLAEKCDFTLIPPKVKLSSMKLLDNVEVVKGHPPTQWPWSSTQVRSPEAAYTVPEC